MTNGKIALITTGVAGAMVLGVLVGPSLMHRDAATTETEAVTAPAPVDVEREKPPVASAPRARVAMKDTNATAAATAAKENRTIAPDRVPSLSAAEPELHARLKPVLNPGTRIADAASGFRDAEQFATVAHAARNTNVPFVVLKHRVLEEKQTLAQAIRASRPDVNAAREVVRAHDAARFDIAVITS
jgi:hypothetical protein